ncbi:MAG: hypothetical protein AAF558_11825 [Verrucomicrobiota bacterium]
MKQLKLVLSLTALFVITLAAPFAHAGCEKCEAGKSDHKHEHKEAEKKEGAKCCGTEGKCCKTDEKKEEKTS